MKDKFTYVDFLMYLLPGSFLATTVLLSVWSFDPSILKEVKGNILSSAVFVIISFVLGNVIQTISHKGPESRLKKQYWHGHFASPLMFFPKNEMINESFRKDLVAMCMKRGLLKPEEEKLFDDELDIDTAENLAEETKEAIEKARNIFVYLYTHLVNTGKGSRVQGVYGYYLFCRGMFVSCLWAAILFSIVAALFALRHYFPDQLIDLLGKTPSPMIGFILPLLEAAFCFYLWRTFRYRARGTSQGFAREVYRTFCASVILQETETDASLGNTRTPQ